MRFMRHTGVFMQQTQLYLFASGVLESQKHYFTLGRGKGEPFNVPVPFYLVRHAQGTVLLDTGNSEKICSHPREHWGDAVDAYYPRMKHSEYVVSQLATLGVRPEEITHILLSHMHLDHAGGIHSFPSARILVQKKEYAWAFDAENTQKNAYINDDLTQNKPEQWQQIEGELDLFGDGSVCAFPTPGHTPGHQSFLIRLPHEGARILTGDACYTTENLVDDIPPGLVWNAEASQKSMQNIRHLAETSKAEIIVGHDPEAWSHCKHAPDFYC